MKTNRFNNIGLWLSFAALLFLILQDLGLSLSSERFDQYVKLGSQILILLGIVNNPTTDNKWFIDDKNKDN